ncbi:MAG: hypothetical protein GX607_12085 [Myxococcales bacterium]|nr:hypothetical protein [Myxococcales bacterium]
MRATMESVQYPVAVSVRYLTERYRSTWVLPEGTVPESVPHNTAARHLELVLEAWSRRTPRTVRVARNLAVRWVEEAPNIGIDPDVCLLEPPPENAEDLGSLCTWRPGQVPPPLCFEIVSANHPHKDYTELQDRYAALGTQELVVFDPLLVGPRSLGGPVPLQVWRRVPAGLFERVHFGDRPAFCEVLGAWLVPCGRLLEIADDRAGVHRWQTEAEFERAEKERERQARIELERRLAALEAQREDHRRGS